MNGERLGTRYARLSLQAHPGARAPLGWTLSEDSMAELDGQLEQSYNNAAIGQVDQWLEDSDSLVCRQGGPSPTR